MPINKPINEESEYDEFFQDIMKAIEKSHGKEALSTPDDISKIGEQVNNQDNKEAVNNIMVVSEVDNLVHNYFHYFEMSWDALDCLSTIILRLPKTDVNNTNYWISYTGDLSVYLGNNIKSEYKDKEKFYDKGDLIPVFKGSVSRVKEHSNQISIQVTGIGKRFKQKIPQEFRESYIYNQNVRDAFQAICEFLGVKFICPPQTEESEDEEADEESAKLDGTENDINQKVATEGSIAKTATTKAKKKNSNKNKKSKKKSSSKKKKSKKNNDDKKVKTISDIDGSTQSDDQKKEEDDELTDNEEIETPQNGYQDVAFDAAGNIVHGQKVIETSPDMAETLMAMEEHPFEKYLEDETGIVEDIKRFMNGEMFEELHNQVMDYNAITIQPKAASSSEMSTTGAATGANANTQNNQQNNGNQSSSSGDTDIIDYINKSNEAGYLL